MIYMIYSKYFSTAVLDNFFQSLSSAFMSCLPLLLYVTILDSTKRWKPENEISGSTKRATLLFLVSFVLGFIMSCFFVDFGSDASKIDRISTQYGSYNAEMTRIIILSKDCMHNMLLFIVSCRINLSIIGWFIMAIFGFVLIKMIGVAFSVIIYHFISKDNTYDYLNGVITSEFTDLLALWSVTLLLCVIEIAAHFMNRIHVKGGYVFRLFYIITVPIVALIGFLYLDIFKSILWLAFLIISWPVALAFTHSIMSGERFTAGLVIKLFKNSIVKS